MCTNAKRHSRHNKINYRMSPPKEHQELIPSKLKEYEGEKNNAEHDL